MLLAKNIPRAVWICYKLTRHHTHNFTRTQTRVKHAELLIHESSRSCTNCTQTEAFKSLLIHTTTVFHSKHDEHDSQYTEIHTIRAQPISRFQDRDM